LIERVNRTYRHEVLDAYLLSDLKQDQEIAEEWIKDYSEDHPHKVNEK